MKPRTYAENRPAVPASPETLERLEELRAILRSESISYGELAELADLAEHIAPDDVELLEAAGVPEFSEDDAQVPEGTCLNCGRPYDDAAGCS